MKKQIILLIAALMLAVTGCYDDSGLKSRMTDLEQRMTTLENMCRQMNTNISSLQTIITALQNKDYVTSVTPVYEDGKLSGYTIEFTKSPAITIYHGSDGQDGQDGQNGADGKDGYTPSISVKPDSDGIYYWTLDGEWLLDNQGNKIPTTGADGKDGSDGKDGADGKDGENGKDGKDGITPEFRIDNGDWYVSIDNGLTWKYLGRATGADGKDGLNGSDGKDGQDGDAGKDGDSMFSSVDTSDSAFVTFVLADGTEIKLPRHCELSIAFDDKALLTMRPNTPRTIKYTISGAMSELQVEVLSSGSVKARISDSKSATGTLSITTGATIGEFDKVIVLVSDGQRTIMSSISFEEAGLRINGDARYTVDAEGRTIDINIETNTEYSVTIPQEAQSWISLPADSRAWRSENIALIIAPNTAAARKATIGLVDSEGVAFGSIVINQESGLHLNIPEDMLLAFPDEIFRNYVLKNFDTDKDGKISTNEALKVTSVWVPQMGIASIEGIQYFPNITQLNCNVNDLTELNVSNNLKLVSLNCGDNELSLLDISQNTGLISLWCIGNNLTSLELSNNAKLRTILCGGNRIAEINLSNNPALNSLNCYGNKLTSLDLSNNPEIEYLYCGDNNINNLNISGCNMFKELDCRGNNISILDVSKKANLMQLNCGSNPLHVLDITHNPKLTQLFCGNDQLTLLDITHNPELSQLSCGNNQLTTLDLSYNNKLTHIDCRNNKLIELDVTKTSLGLPNASRSLYCTQPTLEKLYLKTGWSIYGITEDNHRNNMYISDHTEIVFVD